MTKSDHRPSYDLFVQTPAMIAITHGREIVFEFANPLYLKAVGKTEAIIGKPLLEAMPELKGQPILKILRDVYKTGKSYTGNEVLVHLDVKNTGRAEEMYFNFVYQPLKDESGKIYGTMTHAVDVTEQVMSRKNVEISEAKYKNLFDSINQGFCVIEMIFNKQNKPVDYRYIETNKLFEQQTGLRNVIGKTMVELVPNIESHWLEKYGKVAVTGKPLRFTDGSEAMGRWFDVDASRVGAPENHRVAMLFTDVTERKHIEAGLQKQNYYLEALQTTAVDLSRRVEPIKLMKKILSRAGALAGAPDGYMYLVNESETELVVDVTMGVFRIDTGHRLKKGEGMAGKVWKTGRTLVVDDYDTWSGRASSYPKGRFHSLVGVPLVLGDKVLGVIALAHLKADQKFGAEEVASLERLAELASIALDNTKLYNHAQQEIKERKQAEKALQLNIKNLAESEERFRTLIEKSTDAIQLVSPEGAILYSSESLKNVVGYTPEELKNLGVTPYIHPDDLEYFMQKFTELLQKPKGSIHMQYRVKHKDGSWAWLETTGVNHLGTPNINALVGTFRNITDRKKAEEAIEYQKSLLEAQQEVSPLGIIIVSETGAIVSHNKRFAEMWRFPKKVLDSDLDEMALMAAQKQLKDPKWFIERVTYLYKAREASNELLYFTDGRIFDRYGSPIFGDDGKYFGYVWYFLDITEQKQAEEAVKASEERLRFMAESMPQKVFTATPEGEVDYFNPQWMEYTGLTFDQIRDWGWLQFIHPDDVDENVRTWKYSIRTGEPFELEHRFRGKDGTYHWHFSRVHAMRNEQGKIIKWIGSNTDIESAKRTQKRTRQLEELTATLKQQKNQLIELNEAKDEFISLASHQLRTPATVVKQYLGMVLDEYAGTVPSVQRKMLEKADLSNERQITIINDLLKVAQVDAGKLRLSKQSISMGAMMEQVRNELDSKFRDRNQNVTLILPKDEVSVCVDEARMRMVLDNLIDNASKYTPHGKNIELGVSQGRKIVKVWVRDEGVGIATEDIDKLFRKFSRIDNPLSVMVGGTGLGLYWAKKIIDLHGGTLLVASVPDVGTTFTIIIDRDESVNLAPE